MLESFNPTFSNVVLDGGDDYRLRARHTLTRILRRDTGRIILEELRTSNAQVTITDWTDVRSQNATQQPRTPGSADSIIRFGTAPWSHRRTPDGTARVGPAWSADSVLCHELAHAVRTAGRFTSARVTVPGGPADPEEFFATHVTNVYLSEAGEALKASYYSDEILDPAAFLAYAPNVETLRQFAAQQPRFAGRLAAVVAPFNPFAAAG